MSGQKPEGKVDWRDSLSVSWETSEKEDIEELVKEIFCSDLVSKKAGRNLHGWQGWLSLEGRYIFTDKRTDKTKYFKIRTWVLQETIGFVAGETIILIISILLNGPNLLDTDSLSPPLKCFYWPFHRLSFSF